MSKAQPHLDSSTEAVGRYVQHLAATPQIDAVYVVGSRSPGCDKTPHAGSDWDLMAHKTAPCHLMNPRLWPYELHVDLMSYHDRSDMTEVWPNDPQGVFS